MGRILKLLQQLAVRHIKTLHPPASGKREYVDSAECTSCVKMHHLALNKINRFRKNERRGWYVCALRLRMLTNISVTRWQWLRTKHLAVVPSKLLNGSFVVLLTFWKLITHKGQTGVSKPKVSNLYYYSRLWLCYYRWCPWGNITCCCPVSADVWAPVLFWWYNINERDNIQIISSNHADTLV